MVLGAELRLALGLAIAVAVLVLVIAVLNTMLTPVPSGQSIRQCRDGETPSTALCYEPDAQ